MNKPDIINFLWGALFGMIAPFIGLFVGSQVLPFLGNILLFPIVLISQIVNKPFGEFSTSLMVLSVISSMLVWGFVFMGLSRMMGF